MLISSIRYQRIALVLSQPHTGERGKAERMIGVESEIKIGQQREFAIHADKGFRQKAVVTRVLSNREEGLGPEVDFYIAIGLRREHSRNSKGAGLRAWNRLPRICEWRVG
jgi:hypothetical protein